MRWFRRRVHSSRRRARSSSPRPSGTLWGRLPPTAACRPRRTRQPRHRRRWRRRPAAAGSREAPTPADGRPASGPRSTPPRRTALPRDPDRRPWPGCAASFRPPPAAAGVGSVHLAGNKEVVNGAQRRRRQPGRGPAARVLRDTHRRSRSSRAGALTCCFPRARPSRVAATIAQLWRDAYP